jgi:hypothetical protein
MTSPNRGAGLLKRTTVKGVVGVTIEIHHQIAGVRQRIVEVHASRGTTQYRVLWQPARRLVHARVPSLRAW